MRTRRRTANADRTRSTPAWTTHTRQAGQPCRHRLRAVRCFPPCWARCYAYGVGCLWWGMPRPTQSRCRISGCLPK
ncbi:hypothetical protein [Lysobacter gummosus]|uniref:hypothetical protein n=1 Tax=Lysobacter gummosus TaxID=262324 RepID=UPI00362870AA